MRLIEIQPNGTYRFTRYMRKDDVVPTYAILSHTWQEGEEITFDDMMNDTGKNKAGQSKIRFCAQQAQRDGLRYFWVDSCCINKADSVELQHAINSMFRWYQGAARCYAFLSDVSAPNQGSIDLTDAPTWKEAFWRSRWFTRGWTLQELLAPRTVSFFSREWIHLGDRHDLKHQIQEITGIPVSALSGAPLDSFSIDERLAWSHGRRTTHEEDKAYSLLGIFKVFMLPNYGEGEENAFRRLRKEIEEASQHDLQDLLPQPPTTLASRAHVPPRKTCYTLPFAKNRYFVGRRDELETLGQKLLADCDCESMSIVGLGGTGKTQLALQFAYRVKETMPAVSIFWVPALSMESFEQACTSIIAALHMDQADMSKEDVKVVLREHLGSDEAGRWLLVLDNADDHDLLFGDEQSPGILDYLPRSEKGMTLVTTRVQDIAVSVSRGDVLELGPMSGEEAGNFLQKSLIKKELVQDKETTRQLLEELAYLPLAVAQAAAYLNMNKISVAKYLQLLKGTEQDLVGLMSKGFRDHTRYRGSANAVAVTWIVSFVQICEHDAAAADLLAFMSCIEWRAIPRSLLPRMESEEQTEDAIGTLCGYSFLSRREDETSRGALGEEWYDMHRLVHLAVRIWRSKHQNVAETIERALLHIVDVFPSDGFENQAAWRAYLPHALCILGSTPSCQDKAKSKLSLLVGRCLQQDGRIREAVAWLEESYQGRRRSALKEEDPDRLTSQYALAIAYNADGQVKKAVALLEQVVAVSERVLAEEHPYRLATQHELAGAYLADGQVNKAVALLEQVVAVREKVLAEEHPSRLASQHELAGAYEADGQVKKAVTLLEHVVVVRERVLAEEHPSRLASEHELARTYLADGQIKKAVVLLEHVVAIKTRILRADHPSQIMSEEVLQYMYTLLSDDAVA